VCGLFSDDEAPTVVSVTLDLRYYLRRLEMSGQYDSYLLEDHGKCSFLLKKKKKKMIIRGRNNIDSPGLELNCKCDGEKL